MPVPAFVRCLRLAIVCCSTSVFLFSALASPAQTYKVVLSFDGTDGTAPYSPLVQGPDGNLYGTASNGGTHGNGTFFKVTPSGTITTLYNFCSQPSCTDGNAPQGGVILGTDGNFYGTTNYGGTGTTYCGSGCGTIFKITPSGSLTTLHSFCIASSCLDGYVPTSGLVQGSDGNFYGTAPTSGSFFQGSVYKITPTGTFTTLYDFCAEPGCADGEAPLAGLIQGANGNYYGTTADGGAFGRGEVFEITSTGTLTVLHSFDLTDGGDPTTKLVLDNNGNYYGMTQGGGSSTACFDQACGTIFKMTASGSLSTLVSFDNTNGADPEYNPLVQGSDGNLYGTAGGGTNESAGTIFKITAAGALTTLYDFCAMSGCGDGSGLAALMQATSGTFYGTTAGGGASSNGVIFSLATGAHRFVETVPTIGKVGTKVKILGNNLSGATSVTFNGRTAAFTVVSGTEITTTVPTGATTGKVVVEAGSALSTVVPFRVP
jgi:uncharacterized repeat protein (TIGR03803 family)